MEYKKIICPCCNKEVSIPISKYGTDYEFDYGTLINSEEEFFDLIDMCPECGYVMLFDYGVSELNREFIESDYYQEIRNNPDIEEGLKKWILYAVYSESYENYTEAGIAYTKAYDYLELKNMELDQRLILKAAYCFLKSAEENNSFIDIYLGVDAYRRAGESERAEKLLDSACEVYKGELVDDLVWQEKMHIFLGSTKKEYLDIEIP